VAQVLADITPSDGSAIVTEAATWMGTPYSLVGAASVKGVGGDCSGSTYLIYRVAGFPFDYLQASYFYAHACVTGHFRQLGANDAKQEGDILSWSDHMAVYTSFAADPGNAKTARTNAAGKPWTQINDMWTASHPQGPVYRPNAMRWFKPAPPRVFRYQK